MAFAVRKSSSAEEEVVGRFRRGLWRSVAKLLLVFMHKFKRSYLGVTVLAVVIHTLHLVLDLFTGPYIAPNPYCNWYKTERE